MFWLNGLDTYNILLMDNLFFGSLLSRGKLFCTIMVNIFFGLGKECQATAVTLSPWYKLTQGPLQRSDMARVCARHLLFLLVSSGCPLLITIRFRTRLSVMQIN